MSTIETTGRPLRAAPPVHATDLSKALHARLRKQLRRYIARIRARRTARLLHQLSDRELKDIGMYRDDIQSRSLKASLARLHR